MEKLLATFCKKFLQKTFISHAKIITIATQPDYIDEGITADYLLSKMLYRIEEVMK